MAPSLYRINKEVPNNARMQANVDIHRGARIIAEAPLVSLDIGYSSTYNSNVFFNSTKKYNATVMLRSIYDTLDKKKQRAINALYGDGPVMKVQLNAFEYDEGARDQERCILRLYEKISRMNHSCRPNAVTDWNATLSMATVHAIVEIPKGNEITIDYMAAAQGCLRTTAQRAVDLRKGYQFDCGCVVCGDALVRTTDDKVRKQAAKLYRNINSAAQWLGETPETFRKRRMEMLKAYVDALRALKFEDEKLAWAYIELAKVHEEGYELAKTVPGWAHCASCTNDASSWHHLQRALTAAYRAYEVHLLCDGEDHSDVQNDENEARRRAALAAQLPRGACDERDHED